MGWAKYDEDIRDTVEERWGNRNNHTVFATSYQWYRCIAPAERTAGPGRSYPANITASGCATYSRG